MYTAGSTVLGHNNEEGTIWTIKLRQLSLRRRMMTRPKQSDGAKATGYSIPNLDYPGNYESYSIDTISFTPCRAIYYESMTAVYYTQQDALIAMYYCVNLASLSWSSVRMIFEFYMFTIPLFAYPL